MPISGNQREIQGKFGDHRDLGAGRTKEVGSGIETGGSNKEDHKWRIRNWRPMENLKRELISSQRKSIIGMGDCSRQRSVGLGIEDNDQESVGSRS